MIYATGKITKTIFCPNCFKKISWNDPKDEIILGGKRSIRCPHCNIPIDIAPATILYTSSSYDDNAEGIVNGIPVTNMSEALASLNDAEAILLKNIEAEDIIISNSILNLNGKTITNSNKFYISGNSSIKNGTVDRTTNMAIYAQESSIITIDDITIDATGDGIQISSSKVENGADVTLNNVTINAGAQTIDIFKNSILTINSGSYTSNTGTLCCFGKSTMVINGGTFMSNDREPICTNGTSGYGENTITVNGGTFISNSSKDNIIPCDVYAANDDVILLSKGTFNALNGTAIIVRGGTVTVNTDVALNVSDGQEGVIGNSSVLIPAGKDIVIDKKSAYSAVNTIKVTAEGREIVEINEDTTTAIGQKTTMSSMANNTLVILDREITKINTE